MPSTALLRWQNDRMPRLGYTDAHCAALFAVPPPAAPSPLARESLQAYVMLVSGHFQGFCRDLYTECSQVCIAAVPAALVPTAQMQFAAELKLDSGNPTAENIRKDFERFDISLNLAGAAPGNAIRVTHLGHLNHWRNAVAHQRAVPPPAGVPAALTWALIRTWLASCDGLAASLDDIMRGELLRILGVAPW